jgi:hypothetical protein
VHHVRKGGEKRDDRKTIPLCPDHHQYGGYGVAIEAGKKTWREKFGHQVAMVEEVYRLLCESPDHYVQECIEQWKVV